MSSDYYIIEIDRYKIIEKVSKSEFNLIDTAPTLEAAHILLRELDAALDGCFFIQYPKSVAEKEPGRVLTKSTRQHRTKLYVAPGRVSRKD